MTFTDIISLAKMYPVGVTILVFLDFGIFLFGYFVIYKKIMKKTGKLSEKKRVLWFVFLIYILFVACDTGLYSSGGYENVRLRLQPFSSYMRAWNRFSRIEWRNIIHNIMLFAPMGVLLPLLSRKFQTVWKTYLVGFGVSFLIEITQFILKSGEVEFDVIFNNTLGTMIGYGIIMLLLYLLYDRKCEEKKKLGKTLCLQLPLVIYALAITSIFVYYNKQELGNMEVNYTYKVPMKNVDVSLTTELSDKETNAYVYQTQVGTQQEALEKANKILKKYGTRVDEESLYVNQYIGEYYYHSIDSKYSFFVNFKGLTIWFCDLTQTGAKKAVGYDEAKVREILSKLDIDLPDEISFKEEGEGHYSIKVSMQPTKDGILDGDLTCTITDSDAVDDLDNDIIYYKKYKKKTIRSEKEAFQRVKEGRFNYYLADEIKTIDISDVKLNYQMDSKGFYQPIYEFQAKINGEDTSIDIPALK